MPLPNESTSAHSQTPESPRSVDSNATFVLTQSNADKFERMVDKHVAYNPSAHSFLSSFYQELKDIPCEEPTHLSLSSGDRPCKAELFSYYKKIIFQAAARGDLPIMEALLESNQLVRLYESLSIDLLMQEINWVAKTRWAQAQIDYLEACLSAEVLLPYEEFISELRKLQAEVREIIEEDFWVMIDLENSVGQSFLRTFFDNQIDFYLNSDLLLLSSENFTKDHLTENLIELKRQQLVFSIYHAQAAKQRVEWFMNVFLSLVGEGEEGYDGYQRRLLRHWFSHTEDFDYSFEGAPESLQHRVLRADVYSLEEIYLYQEAVSIDVMNDAGKTLLEVVIESRQEGGILFLLSRCNPQQFEACCWVLQNKDPQLLLLSEKARAVVKELKEIVEALEERPADLYAYVKKTQQLYTLSRMWMLHRTWVFKAVRENDFSTVLTLLGRDEFNYLPMHNLVEYVRLLQSKKQQQLTAGVEHTDPRLELPYPYHLFECSTPSQLNAKMYHLGFEKDLKSPPAAVLSHKDRFEAFLIAVSQKYFVPLSCDVRDLQSQENMLDVAYREGHLVMIMKLYTFGLRPRITQLPLGCPLVTSERKLERLALLVEYHAKRDAGILCQQDSPVAKLATSPFLQIVEKQVNKFGRMLVNKKKLLTEADSALYDFYQRCFFQLKHNIEEAKQLSHDESLAVHLTSIIETYQQMLATRSAEPVCAVANAAAKDFAKLIKTFQELAARFQRRPKFGRHDDPDAIASRIQHFLDRINSVLQGASGKAFVHFAQQEKKYEEAQEAMSEMKNEISKGNHKIGRLESLFDQLLGEVRLVLMNLSAPQARANRASTSGASASPPVSPRGSVFVPVDPVSGLRGPS